MATLSNNDIAESIYFISKGKSKEELHLILKKVVEFLDRRRLLSRSKDILEKLEKIINFNESRVVVKVLSSKKLSEKIKGELISILGKRYKAKEIILLEKLDEKLLGGVRLEIDDEVIDLTVKKKIQKLQEHLTKKYE